MRLLLPACSRGIQGNEKGEIVIVRHVLPAIGARTSYWNLRLGRVGFLLSSVFAGPVSSTTGLRTGFSSHSASTAGASLSWAPAALRLFRMEVVSARFYPSHGTIDVTRVYARFFVSSQQKFGVTDIKAP